MEEQTKKEMKAKGSKALLINIIFFFILFLGIIMYVYTNLTATVIVISVIFIASLLYIYSS
jgi:cbb3-type cytochrome oxidase subunit 3